MKRITIYVADFERGAGDTIEEAVGDEMLICCEVMTNAQTKKVMQVLRELVKPYEPEQT